MHKLLIHIRLLFALVFLFCTLSAYGQSAPSVSIEWPTTPDVDYNIIDLGLDVYWADRNVGATDYQDVGSYFNWSQASTWNDTSSTATPKWGGYWRTPTKEEFNNLVNNTSNAGHPNNFRCTFTNISNSTLSIILTSTGYEGCIDLSEKTMGYYWTSTFYKKILGVPYSSYRFKFDCCTWYPNDKWYVSYGFVIRPVIDKCSNVVINAQYPGNTNESTVASSQSYPKGSTLHAETVECYHYQWYKNASPVAGGYNNDIEVTESNATYKVVYFKKVHEITTQTYPADNEYGTATIENSIDNNKYESCTTITLKATPKDSCYYFVEWKEVKNGKTTCIRPNTQGYTCSTTGGVNTLEVTIDTIATYTAFFEQYQRSVTAAPNDGNLGCIKDSAGIICSNLQTSMDCGNRFKIMAKPNDCVKFLGWDSNGDINTIEYDSTHVDDESYKSVKDGDGNYVLTIYNVTDPLDLVAVFKKDSFNITATPNAANYGYVTDPSHPKRENNSYTTTIECGKSDTLLAVHRNDCIIFEKWVDTFVTPNVFYKPGDNTPDYKCITNDTARIDTLIIYNVDRPFVLEAVFKMQTHQILAEVSPKGSGSVQINEGNDVGNIYDCDKALTLTAESEDCYAFDHWTKMIKDESGEYTIEVPLDDEIANSPKISVLPDQDTKYVATFKKKDPVTVTVYTADSDKGTVSIAISN